VEGIVIEVYSRGSGRAIRRGGLRSGAEKETNKERLGLSILAYRTKVTISFPRRRGSCISRLGISRLTRNTVGMVLLVVFFGGNPISIYIYLYVCVCVCVCLCIYLCIHIYTYIHIYLSIYLSLYISLSTVYPYLSIYL